MGQLTRLREGLQAAGQDIDELSTKIDGVGKRIGTAADQAERLSLAAKGGGFAGDTGPVDAQGGGVGITIGDEAAERERNRQQRNPFFRGASRGSGTSPRFGERHRGGVQDPEPQEGVVTVGVGGGEGGARGPQAEVERSTTRRILGGISALLEGIGKDSAITRRILGIRTSGTATGDAVIGGGAAPPPPTAPAPPGGGRNDLIRGPGGFGTTAVPGNPPIVQEDRQERQREREDRKRTEEQSGRQRSEQIILLERIAASTDRTAALLIRGVGSSGLDEQNFRASGGLLP